MEKIAIKKKAVEVLTALPDEAFLEAFERESQAFLSLRKQLFKDYAGTFVAIKGGQVIDSDVDKKALAKRVRAKYGPVPVYFGLVGGEEFRIEHIRSPRARHL